MPETSKTTSLKSKRFPTRRIGPTTIVWLQNPSGFVQEAKIVPLRDDLFLLAVKTEYGERWGTHPSFHRAKIAFAKKFMKAAVWHEKSPTTGRTHLPSEFPSLYQSAENSGPDGSGC